jgi:hypothetical protein
MRKQASESPAERSSEGVESLNYPGPKGRPGWVGGKSCTKPSKTWRSTLFPIAQRLDIDPISFY